MTDTDETLLGSFASACSGFAARLRQVQPGQWTRPTPCTEWNVRHLVNHMTRGNLSYAALLCGGTGQEFLRMRDADALGDDAVAAYRRSVTSCLITFRQPGVLDRVADYPLGAASGPMPGPGRSPWAAASSPRPQATLRPGPLRRTGCCT